MHDQSASEHTSQLISDLSAIRAAISAVTEREFNGCAKTVDHAPPDLAPRLFAYLAHASDYERVRHTRCPLPLRALQKATPHDQPRVKTDERPLTALCLDDALWPILLKTPFPELLDKFQARGRRRSFSDVGDRAFFRCAQPSAF